MRVSLWKTSDAISIKIDGTKHKEEGRSRDPGSQNPLAAVRPEQQGPESKTGGHDAHPRNQDIPDRQGEMGGERNAPRRVQKDPQPVIPSKRRGPYRIKQIVGGDHSHSQ